MSQIVGWRHMGRGRFQGQCLTATRGGGIRRRVAADGAAAMHLARAPVVRAEQRVLMAGNGTAANGTAANLTAPPQLVVNATAVLAAARAASTSQLAANTSAAAQKSARDESDSRWWDPNIWMLQMQSLHS